MQDEIVARLANALNTQLIIAEAQRAEHAPNPDSMDLCFQGWAGRIGALRRTISRRRAALRARPGARSRPMSGALVGIATLDLSVALCFLVDDRAAAVCRRRGCSSHQGAVLAPENAFAHLCLGAVQISTNRAAQGVRHCERALELDRNLASAHANRQRQNSTRPGRGYRGSHPGGAAPQSPRHVRIHLVFRCRGGQTSPWR